MSYPMSTAKGRYEAAEQLRVLVYLAMERDENYPDIPCIAELVDLTEYQKSLINSIGFSARLFVAPPGTPKDRVEFLRDSFASAMDEISFRQGVLEYKGFWTGTWSGEWLAEKCSAVAAAKSDMEVYHELVEKYCK